MPSFITEVDVDISLDELVEELTTAERAQLRRMLSEAGTAGQDLGSAAVDERLHMARVRGDHQAFVDELDQLLASLDIRERAGWLLRDPLRSAA